MTPKKVTLVVDREGRDHTNFWTGILADLTKRKVLETEVTTVPLADWLALPLDQAGSVLVELIERPTDILIINWDVMNGDPDFGGDVTLGWFEHRHFALRRWLNAGGLLIIDGQAAQGVPDDRYYAAILGEEEVRLSGRQDPTDPEKEKIRMVGGCRMTRLARRTPGFEGLERVTPRADLRFEDLYPPATTGRLVPRYLHEIDTSRLLYRGWFRRFLPSRTLKWMPYVRRDKPWPRNFPTMLAAKCGNNKGMVFATTMMLAATRQTELIRAMLSAHGRVSDLPEPGAFRRAVSRYAPKFAAGVLTALVLFFLSKEDTVRWVIISALVGLAVTVLLDLLPWIWRSTHRLVRAFTGA